MTASNLSTIKIERLEHSVRLPSSRICFYGDYRFPLLGLDEELGLSTGPADLDLDAITDLLSRRENRCDFYWLSLRGMATVITHKTSGIEANQWRLDATEQSIQSLVNLGKPHLAERFMKAIKEVELDIGISSFNKEERDRYLRLYGYCAKANHQVLLAKNENTGEARIINGRPKNSTVRNGMPGRITDCKQLIRSIFRKEFRNKDYEGYQLFRRAMPSAGSLCCIEAVLIHREGIFLYDSQLDIFEMIHLLEYKDIDQINGDLWLNCGNIESRRSSAVILFAVQEQTKRKYGEISLHLQALETGILLADLWNLMPSHGLEGCILGNPMMGALTRYIKDILGEVLPMGSLMLFDAASRVGEARIRRPHPA